MIETPKPQSGMEEPGSVKQVKQKPICRCPCTCGHKGTCAFCQRVAKQGEANG